MSKIENLKIAVVHDWLTGMRGGEKVLEIIFELFPGAELFTLLYNEGSVSPLIADRKIHTSFINKLPFKSNKYRNYLPLFPTAIELFDFKEYDLIISTSHCVAKGVRTPPNTLHVSYVHSPMRYVWDMYEDYFGYDKIGFLQKLIIPPFANYLRMWDVTSSNRVDYFIANSQHVANRIKKYYRRDSTVIHPPVNTEIYKKSEINDGFYLVVSALVPYKRIDLAVEAFNNTGKNLLIIGEGPEKSKLRRIAKDNIQFVDGLKSEELVNYYSKCKALIFPGEEDFGIIPVEAQSCGKPVIAFARGGALETIIGYDGKNEKQCTGLFFEDQNSDSLLNAIEKFEKLSWDKDVINQHAQKFNRNRFKNKLSGFFNQKVSDFLGELFL
jgi:glycosyltransferase involved in cell wall biosynthesis